MMPLLSPAGLVKVTAVPAFEMGRGMVKEHFRILAPYQL